MKLPYGKFKGKEISEIAMLKDGPKYLEWLKGQLDPNDAKYGDKNRAIINEIDDTLKISKVKQEVNGTITTDGTQVCIDRLGGLHKLVSEILENQKKMLEIIETKETQIDDSAWS